MSKIAQSGVTLAVIAILASGAHADVSGTPAWSFAGDASVATLTPSADGKSATLVGNGTAGNVSISVTVDGFTKTDTFEFDAVVPAPAPAPVDAVVAIDWTVTPIESAAALAAPAPAAG